MNKKVESKHSILIFGITVITIVLLSIIFQYTLNYNINGNKIENYITQRISKISKENDTNIVVLDKLKTDFGLVILFETSIKNKPIGYAVFKKDAIFNKYYNEDFATYDNRLDYNGDSDALIDLNSENVFKFQDDKIELINSKQNKKRLIKYYVDGILLLIIFIYGLFICIKQLRIKRN